MDSVFDHPNRRRYYIIDEDWFNIYFNKIKSSENDCITGQCKRCSVLFNTYSKRKYELSNFVDHIKSHEERDRLYKPPSNYKRIEGKKYWNDKDGIELFTKYFIQSATCGGVIGGCCKQCNQYIETFEEVDYCLDKFESHLDYHGSFSESLYETIGSIFNKFK